jgi:RND family efflux transporter MFP subunit
MKAIWIAAVLLGACSSKPATAAGGGKGPRKLEYPVEVAPLETRPVTYEVTAPGSIDAFQQVQITARVAGAVDKVAFVEGQVVAAGDVLATIESDRYQNAVDQAKAALAKSSANQKSAEAQLARRTGASAQNPGLIPGEEIETHETAVDVAKADVASARQAVRVAELNLRDSFVRAPIAGVVQTRTVQTGQYLQPGAVLATILQRDPLLLRFQVTEQDAPRLQPGMIANLTLRESTREYSAKITLVAGAADPATRLVPVTAEIDSTDHQYWLRPGAFCEVRVPIGNARPGIVVPTMAVEPTEKGNLVYVVQDGVAHARVVALGMHTADGGVEVKRGLSAGELLVVRGVEPLSDGAPVKISAQTTLAAAQARPDAGPAQPAVEPTAPASAPAESAPASAPAAPRHKRAAPP